MSELMRAEGFPFADLEDLMGVSGEPVASSPISTLERVRGVDAVYYVKKYYRSGKYLRRYAGRSRLRAEYDNLRLFRSLDIPVPEIAAFGEDARRAHRGRGVLVTTEVPDALDLATIASDRKDLLKDRMWLDEVLGQIARHVRVLHERGFIHHDLKWRNLLVGTQGDPVVYFIDCPQGGRRLWPLRSRGVVKDLACFDKMAKHQLPRTARMRCYLRYRQRRGLSACDKRLLAKVTAFFEGRE